MLSRFPLLPILLGISACTALPDLPPAPVAAGSPPHLLPLDQLLSQAASTSAAQNEALAARAAALQRRAAALRNASADPR
ncbi:hypothetical protein Q9295_04955 [Xinfangfangia sp. CPCC 101601]|uniref:Uncharacterized protein n=1 Tax=Pseudogemmobacter lacusdianii TaxID=3069608 RepID=A0ABU0VVD0_9RHOB|nr:hypothetical protein [Xinfangfangia sp. CPCC 101601]MDQ2065709.1 hypothetical protein [Xinfangfangia sp. CPCC 101601]